MDLEQGLFRDDPLFDQLVDDLSQDLLEIATVNSKAWDQLRRRRTAAKNGQSAASHETVMDAVQSNQLRFRQVKPELERLQQWSDATAPQRYSQHKLAADFKDVFTEFQRIQQQVLAQSRHEIEERTTSSENARNSRHDSRGIEMDESPGYDDPTTIQDTSVSPDLLSPEPADNQAASQAFAEQLRQDEISYQAGLVAEREEEIENVSRGMNELNEIFQNLSTIVTEQGTVLDNIESNIYNVAASTGAGSQQLTKAARWQRSSTSRSLCFLIILLVLAVVVILSASIH